MKLAILAGTTGVLLLWSVASLSYEPDTHATLSDLAAKQSVLVLAPSAATTSILQDFGLSTYTDANQTFRFVQQNENVRRGPDGTDDFPTSLPSLTIQGLIIAGAELEDEDDRALNHFYDPVNDIGLNLAGFPVPDALKTPAWAEGSSCPNLSANAPYDPIQSNSKQCFSLQDALSYFRFALTDSDPVVRSDQFGDLFLTLGHVLHLVQDMAQPQHVRNDRHCDDPDKCPKITPLYNPSRYEAFAYNQVNGGRVNLLGYPLAALPTANSYWTTGIGTGTVGGSGQRQGLADYTNTNFVSIGTNFTFDQNGNPTAGVYQNPVPSTTINIPIDQLYTPNQLYSTNLPEPAQIRTYCASVPNGCMVSFIDTFVMDHLNPSLNQSNPYASSYSIFDQDLQNFNACAAANVTIGETMDQCRLFTLNNFNYAAAENFLLPRAVGYSAGLINYFFRGKLGVQPDPNNIDNYIVSNLSGYELKGSIEFYYDDPSGNRYPIISSKTTVDLPGLASGSLTPSTQSIPVVLPAYPQTQATGSFMAVFNGNIGTEPGIAGKQFADDFYLFDDDSHLYSGLAQAYSGPGVLINEFALGVPDAYQITMAASGGSVYASGANLSAPSGTPGYMVVRDGDPIVRGIAFPDDIAVNDNNLFVITNTTGSESIATYDLAGNPAPPSSLSSLSIPDQAVMGMGANDKVICITGLDENGNGQDLLYNLSTGAELPTLKAAPDGFDRCAVTSDRVYVVRQLSNGDTGPINVDVYDNNGSPVASFPVDGETYSFGIAATDKRVYVQVWDDNGAISPANPSGYEQGVAIYQRNPAADTFKLLGKIWVSSNNGNEITRDVAVDVKAVIANGDH